MRFALAALTLATASSALAAITELDSSLHRSFYGIAYSPDGVILPDCGATQEQITEDVLLLAQLTPRIRTYASDCGQVDMIMSAINQTNADLTVWFGVFLASDNTIETVYQRQMDVLTAAIAKYGTKHIGGITVGNEFILQGYGDSGTAADANGVAARATVLEYVQKANTTLNGLSLDKTIPIGTSDAGSAATVPLCSGVDYFMANVHPYFGSVAYEQASAWTFNFFKEFDVDVCAQAANTPHVYIAETGWPTESMNASAATNGAGSPASIEGLNTFMSDFVCAANSNSTDYFFFEFKDEPWKRIYGGVEPYWGLFNTNRTLKAGLTLPTCEVTSPTGGTVSQIQFSTTSSGSSGSSGSSSGSGGGSAGFRTANGGFSSLALGAAGTVFAGSLILLA